MQCGRKFYLGLKFMYWAMLSVLAWGVRLKATCIEQGLKMLGRRKSLRCLHGTRLRSTCIKGKA